MKRKLLLADLVLLALAAAAAVHLRQEWVDAHTYEQAQLQRRMKPAPPPPMAPLPVAGPVKAAVYSDIAQKTLFSKDRNPTVVIALPPPPPPKPMPALPLFHGLVDFGDGPIAVMSENAKAPHRDYRPGESVGPFKLVAVDREEITFEWDGKTITRKVEELLDRSTPPPSNAAPVKAAVEAPPKPAQPATTAPSAPGVDLGRGIHACAPGDSSPAGTVNDGMRKVIKGTPFGKSCYWEPAN
ncbi:MAG TPA: hypothetical protein VMT86_11560 [Bryobacteraceae bacterium]|nr:hypothetical protein [Bryobacteraceae bacterium]